MKYLKESIKFFKDADKVFNYGNKFAILQAAYT